MNLLKSLFNGDEPAVASLREQLLQAVSTPGLTTLLLQAPPGTGKTTIARAVAAARMLTMVDRARLPVPHAQLIDAVRRGHPLKWFRDLSLAGLSPTLAESQLFGVVSGYATGVKPRIGIFERAMTGSTKESEEDAHKKIVARESKADIIPRLTGGVVLLDEIGDLDKELQAKLLRVLNGEKQFRLGGEGNEDFGFTFRGLVVFATWRDLGDLRPDLRQRLMQNHVRVPSLSQYSAETRKLFLGSVLENLRQVAKDEMDQLDACEKITDQAKDEYPPTPAPAWRASLEAIVQFKPAPNDVDTLVAVDWSKLGELRGMRVVLRRLMSGQSVQDALAACASLGNENAASGGQTLPAGSHAMPSDADDIAVLIRAMKDGTSVSDMWGSLRRDWGTRMYNLLVNEDPAAFRALKLAGISEQEVKSYKAQLKNLKRDGVPRELPTVEPDQN